MEAGGLRAGCFVMPDLRAPTPRVFWRGAFVGRFDLFPDPKTKQIWGVAICFQIHLLVVLLLLLPGQRSRGLVVE